LILLPVSSALVEPSLEYAWAEIGTRRTHER